MADLEPRVKQVEEDVAILKGEIKSVLTEVRTTILSHSNPFTAPAAASTPTPAPSFAPPAMPAFPGPPAGANAGPFFPGTPEPMGNNPGPQAPFFQEESHSNAQPQSVNHNESPRLAALPGQEPQQPVAPQQPVPLPVAPRRSWELNTLAMLLAWCQGNMVRLSEKEMTSLLSLARYGGLVDEELAAILLDISTSFDDGKVGRAATVSEYLLALHELHTVIKEEEEPARPRLLRAG
jgi:hypothetical protein